MMADQYLGEIRIFSCNFAPYGWAFCQGQILPISQYTALFSLLGTTYGGNGTSNFGLPNFQGRAGNNFGQAPGLSFYSLGETGGEVTVTLNTNEMAAHSHSANCLKGNGDSNTPVNHGWAEVATGRGSTPLYATSNNTSMSHSALSNTGGSQPHNNMAPYLSLNFCIALSGIYPTRG
jgi:microcystin-dependent protein